MPFQPSHMYARAHLRYDRQHMTDEPFPIPMKKARAMLDGLKLAALREGPISPLHHARLQKVEREQAAKDTKPE